MVNSDGSGLAKTHCDLNEDAPIQEDAEATVFNIQRYSIQDGPGIRTTVFLKGCPLRCAWCSNPESQNSGPEVVHRDSLCTKCARCVELCSEQAISLVEGKVHINRETCSNCGRCVTVCDAGALKLFGESLSARSVFKQIEKDAEFYRESGGGVTVSGGEPLSQAPFVAALFQLCQAKGIETCVETSGYASQQALEKVAPFTSLFLFDVKLSRAASHQEWTGRSNQLILSNLKRAVASGKEVIMRIPLIPGINDSEEELRELAIIALDYLKEPRKVNLLPYHRFGMGKYQMLDRSYDLSELVSQKDAELQKHKQLFESYGLHCEIVY